MNAPQTLLQRVSRYPLTKIGGDLATLPAGDRAALPKLAAAAKLIHQLYARQVAPGIDALRARLEAAAGRSLDDVMLVKDVTTLSAAELTLRCFGQHRAPWDSGDDEAPFVDGVGECPAGANFYPADMTVAEFDAWKATLSPADQARAEGFYDIVVRDAASGALQLVPYAEAYKDLLAPLARHLRDAAATVSDASLAHFLQLRADAFESNRYLDSEVAWLRVSSRSALEVTVGPYETYRDKLKAAKAAFEMYIHMRDFGATDMLEKFSGSLLALEQALPVPSRYKNASITAAPIVVVNQLMSAGDVAGSMTAAYNLPNDEEAVKRGGSKLVLISNVQRAKFDSVLVPIAQRVIDPAQLGDITYDAFFTHVLAHECAHSNGPQHVVAAADGTPAPGDTVRSRLQELYARLEEAKADIVGLFAATGLFQDLGLVPHISPAQFYTTFLASSFRSIRFGLGSAHAKGQIIQNNFISAHGGFEYDAATRRFRVNHARVGEAVRLLASEILQLQGNGDKAAADAFVAKYSVVPPEIEQALEMLQDLPVDVQPHYTLLDEAH